MTSLNRGHVVEIFKTNVTHTSEANFIIKNLHKHFPSCRVNFDLNDCDRILRIEGKAADIDIESILKIVKENNYEIELIED